MFAVAVTVLLYPLPPSLNAAHCPPLCEILVRSFVPNGLTSRPSPAELLLHQLLRGPFFWDSWVVVVTQAGQLEGIRRGITSTSPPAPHHSAAVVVLPIDGWTWSGGVGLLIREGSVRGPQRSHSCFSQFVFHSRSHFTISTSKAPAPV